MSFDNYEIIEIIGSGNFGKVFKVKRKSDGKEIALKAMKIRKEKAKTSGPFVYVACETEPLRRDAFKTMNLLRNAGISADGDILGRSLKAQMREANRLGAKKVIIVGDRELEEGVYEVKDMQTGEQVRMPQVELKV